MFWNLSPFIHDVRLRVRDDPGGRLVIYKLAVEAYDSLIGPGSIAPTTLRDVALGRVEGLINSPAWSSAVRASIECADSGPDFSPEGCPPELAQRRAEALPLRHQPQSYRIEVPDERVRGDDFYRQVADVYSTAYQVTKRPAVEIAEASGVAVTTVHRWLKEARRRGVLAPARRTPGQIDLDLDEA